MESFDKHVKEILKSGGIGVIPTDTIYGIVCRADMKASVERLYRVRKRNPEKPCVVLIASYTDLERFDVHLTPEQTLTLETHKLWPGQVSIIIPAPHAPLYLTRGTGSLAFRLPDVPALLELLTYTGPLIAPSANFEGLPSARSIEDARGFFGDTVDVYVDNGVMHYKPSTIVRMTEHMFEIVREGVVILDQSTLRFRQGA